MSEFAKTPKPPYYAVIFTSIRTEGDNGYAKMVARMEELAREQKGFLGTEAARENLGITVSYWNDLESIKDWHEQAKHKLAQAEGYKTWYQSFTTRVCKVERDYDFQK